MKSIIKLHYLPYIIAGLLLVNLTICFAVACCILKHVSYRYPHISDLGTFPPESCIFAQGMNMYAVLLGYVMYIKYKQVQSIYKKHELVERCKLNTPTFIVGMISVFGLSVAGNFQETNLGWVHFCGALASFGGGAVYICMQTIIYLRLSSVIRQRKRNITRISLCVLCLVNFIGYIASAATASLEFKGKNMTKWTMTDEGVLSYYVSSVFEWIMAIIINVYIMQFRAEFKKTTVDITVDYDEEHTTTSND